MCYHERLLKAAYKQASFSEHKMKMSAVLARGSKIISIGVNRINKTHPRQGERVGQHRRYGRHRIHAELDSIIKAGAQQAEGATLYVARRRADGSFGLAKPCEICRSILIKYNIDKVYYTLSSPNIPSNEKWYDFEDLY